MARAAASAGTPGGGPGLPGHQVVPWGSGKAELLVGPSLPASGLYFERLTLLPCVVSVPVMHSQMDSQLVQGTDEDRNCVSPLKSTC